MEVINDKKLVEESIYWLKNLSCLGTWREICHHWVISRSQRLPECWKAGDTAVILKNYPMLKAPDGIKLVGFITFFTYF